MEILKDEWYVMIKACTFTVIEILRDFWYYHILHVLAIPTYRAYQLYDYYKQLCLLQLLLPDCICA